MFACRRIELRAVVLLNWFPTRTVLPVKTSVTERWNGRRVSQVALCSSSIISGFDLSWAQRIWTSKPRLKEKDVPGTKATLSYALFERFFRTDRWAVRPREGPLTWVTASLLGSEQNHHLAPFAIDVAPAAICRRVSKLSSGRSGGIFVVLLIIRHLLCYTTVKV